MFLGTFSHPFHPFVTPEVALNQTYFTDSVFDTLLLRMRDILARCNIIIGCLRPVSNIITIQPTLWGLIVHCILWKGGNVQKLVGEVLMISYILLTTNLALCWNVWVSLEAWPSYLHLLINGPVWVNASKYSIPIN